MSSFKEVSRAKKFCWNPGHLSILGLYEAGSYRKVDGMLEQ
jgi:hypothetical protein